MIVDSSAILAVLFGEPNAEWVASCLDEHPGALAMSTVNLAEPLIRLKDRHPAHYEQLRAELDGFGIGYVAPDAAKAEAAALARLRFPLNVGDCFCYALGLASGEAILTVDMDVRGIDHGVVWPPHVTK